jgi:four helix bundle protein
MRSDFRDLVAYQRAIELADDLYEQIPRWPPDDRWTLGRQMIRALDSIGANIAEGTGRWHRNDQRHLLIVARGSLLEAEHWITTAERRGLLQAGTSERLTEVARALQGLLRKRGPG